MKKISLILISVFVLFLFPLKGFAQIDFLDQLLNGGNSEGGTVEEEINLKSIDLIWSADSYVPYDYQGRALVSEGAIVTIEAILETEGGNQANLQYSWFVDDRFEEAKSGYGRKSFSFGTRRGAGDSHTVLVKIFNESRSFYIEKSITIPIVAPEITIYVPSGSSSFPSHSRSFSGVLSNKKLLFTARPFFFGVKKLTDLDFEWRVEQKAVNASNNILNLTVAGKNDNKEFDESLYVVATNKILPEQKAFKTIELKIF